ncbi:MAG: nuclear transport factor 2 family protein [Blastomonas sp.]
MAVTEQYRHAAEADCLRTIITFYRRLDASDYAGVLALWHDDGTWVRQRLFAKHEFMESLKLRSPNAVVFHVVSNAMFEIEKGRARFSCYVTSIVGDTGSPPQGPIPPNAMRLYLCTGELVEQDGKWLMFHYAPGKPRLELLGTGVPSRG